MGTISGEDDVVETSMDENSNEKQEEAQQEEAQQDEEQDEVESSPEQQHFLCNLGLITKFKFIELQNRRVERKRRSTANPQFVYSMLEQPSVSVMCDPFLRYLISLCIVFSHGGLAPVFHLLSYFRSERDTRTCNPGTRPTLGRRQRV